MVLSEVRKTPYYESGVNTGSPTHGQPVAAWRGRENSWSNRILRVVATPVRHVAARNRKRLAASNRLRARLRYLAYRDLDSHFQVKFVG